MPDTVKMYHPDTGAEIEVRREAYDLCWSDRGWLLVGEQVIVQSIDPVEDKKKWRRDLVEESAPADSGKKEK